MLRGSRVRWIVWASCCLWLAACVPSAVSAEAESAVEAPVVGLRTAAAGVGQASAVYASRADTRRPGETRFRGLSLTRAGIAGLGVGVYGLGVWLRRRGLRDDWFGLRQATLALLAVAAFAGYYNFLQLHHPGGFKGADVFHYYMGSKYFDELGYFDLYPCALAALVADGLQDIEGLPEVRNQRTLRMQSDAETRADMQRCPGRFDAGRWDAFRSDVAFFRPRIQGGSWTHLFEDHGYNPTPVWSFVGGLVSGRVPATADSLPVLIRIDRVLIVLMGALIAWVFGFEAAALAAIVWGTSPLWSYNWTGDAFLRHLWLFSSVAGLCLLERGRHFASGLWLSLAALLRIFPGIFAFGYLVHAVRRFRSDGVPRPTRRFVAGLALGGVVLLAAGAFATSHGVGAYVEFRSKMSGVVAQPGVNKVGLSALATEIVYRATTLEVTTPDGRVLKVPEPAPVTVIAVRVLQAAVVIVGLLAFWRAASRVEGFEAAALGFALIPLLTSPTNYYYPFVIAAAMLSARRAWVGVALATTLIGWICADQIWFLDPVRYIAFDVIAVAFALTVLLGMGFSRRPGPASAGEIAAAPGIATTA